MLNSSSDPALTARPIAIRAPRRGRPLSSRIPLVDALPDLAAQRDGERLELARRAVRVRVLAVRRGLWAAADDAAAPDCYGFVLVSGTLLRRVTAGHREGAELLGAGDLIQPASEAPDVSWRVVADCTVAVLDLRALADASAVPELAGALLGAANARTQTVAR